MYNNSMKEMNITGMKGKVNDGIKRAFERKPDPREQQKTDYSELSDEDNKITYMIDISWSMIWKIILVLGVIYFGSQLFQVALVLFVAFVMASAALPLIRAFMKKGLPKGLSIFLTYVGGIVIILALLSLIALPFMKELNEIRGNLPDYADSASENIAIVIAKIPLVNSSKEVIIERVSVFFSEQLDVIVEDLSGSVFSTVETLIDVGMAFWSLFIAVAISIYMVIDHDNFLDLLMLRISSKRQRSLVKKMILNVENKLGNWLIGQGLLSFVIFLMVWAMLSILKVPFALPLAVLAGILEIIPALGPTIAAVPAIVIAFFAVGPLQGILVFVGYLVVQQLENSLIVPKIMGNTVGVKPIVIMIGVLVGGAIGGWIGAILAVPVLVLAQIFYEFYVELRKIRVTSS